MKENIVLNRALQERYQSHALTVIDRAVLALAFLVCDLFPEYLVYVDPQQQNVKPPALFVRFYSITGQADLDDMKNYLFGFEISYVPQNERMVVEMENVIFKITQEMGWLEYGLICYSTQGDITDGIAHITGELSVYELFIPEDPMIQIADKELIV